MYSPPGEFHLSLTVRELPRAVAFYKVLFGIPPAKSKADYAKFKVDDPALVLSLEPAAKSDDANLNHVGLRMAASKTRDRKSAVELSGSQVPLDEAIRLVETVSSYISTDRIPLLLGVRKNCDSGA